MADEFDFGFTAVDEDELGLVVSASQPSPPPSVSPDALEIVSLQLVELKNAIAAIKIPAPVSTPSIQLSRVEEKIDRVLNMELGELNATLQSQGESISSVLDEVEERSNATRAECKEKLQATEKLILPLLQNLMKNPEKSYIKWENRAEKISSHIDKITAITRSYGV